MRQFLFSVLSGGSVSVEREHKGIEGAGTDQLVRIHQIHPGVRTQQIHPALLLSGIMQPVTLSHFHQVHAEFHQPSRPARVGPMFRFGRAEYSHVGNYPGATARQVWVYSPLNLTPRPIFAPPTPTHNRDFSHAANSDGSH